MKRQQDRHGIQPREGPPTTIRHPQGCSCWPRARCSRASTCASCPSSAQSGRARWSAAHCIIDRCSTQAQVRGATGRCIGLSPGASCTIRKHSVCSHQPPRSAPPHARPDRAEHMQRNQRKWALNPSERHHRHEMQPRDGTPTTFCQPPCCSRCSDLAAAVPAHAHHAPSGAL